jgi:hypothetical protein
VVDQRDPKSVVELGARDRIRRRNACTPRRYDAFDLAKASVDILGFFVPEHVLSCRIDWANEWWSLRDAIRIVKEMWAAYLHLIAHQLRGDRKISAILRHQHDSYTGGGWIRS